MNSRDLRNAYQMFMSRIWDRWRADESKMRIREFQDLLFCIKEIFIESDFIRKPHEGVPFQLITIRGDGGISTFSPELSATKSLNYGDFLIGNVLTDSPLNVANKLMGSRLYRDAMTSRKMCKETCSYHPLCGGALFSNKFAEHGSLLATETTSCRLHRQALSDVVLDKLAAGPETGNQRVAPLPDSARAIA